MDKKSQPANLVLVEKFERKIGSIGEENPIIIKYLYVCDNKSAERESFLRDSFPSAEIFSHRIISSIYPCTEDRPDVVVVGGNDEKRLTSFIKANRLVLRDYPTIALGLSLTPSERAKLLRLGFDDVLNLQNLDKSEFTVRVAALRRRYRITQENMNEVFKFDETLSSSCHADRLSSSQRRVMDVLVRAKGKVCRFSALTSSLAGDYHEASSTRHLRVVIHHLKRHLKPGVSIESVRGIGYHLVYNPPEHHNP